MNGNKLLDLLKGSYKMKWNEKHLEALKHAYNELLEFFNKDICLLFVRFDIKENGGGAV